MELAAANNNPSRCGLRPPFEQLVELAAANNNPSRCGQFERLVELAAGFESPEEGAWSGEEEGDDSHCWRAYVLQVMIKTIRQPLSDDSHCWRAYVLQVIVTAALIVVIVTAALIAMSMPAITCPSEVPARCGCGCGPGGCPADGGAGARGSVSPTRLCGKPRRRPVLAVVEPMRGADGGRPDAPPSAL